MIKINDKKDCCGCTACYNACPVNAIKMEADEEGFLYPIIDPNRCTNCGLCEKSCPIINHIPVVEKQRTSFVARAKNLDIVLNSTSGGFVTPLANWVLQQNGVVCGASFDENYNIIHKIIKSPASPIEFQGSKYVQSDLGECFSEIKKKLNDGTMVCFIGTPCQVYGLKTFLRKEYEKLITIDVVCHGIPSPKLWKQYLNYITSKYHAGIESIEFRKKTYGYHSSTMFIQFNNGKTYHGSGRVDFMLKSFFSNISLRPSCYYCKFKTVERCSDFTIFDCWHTDDLIKTSIDDDKGFTNIIVQSSMGEKILKALNSSYFLYPSNTEKAIALDGIMARNSANRPKVRDNFYQDLNSLPFQVFLKKYIPNRVINHLVEYSKCILYRIGLYTKIKGLIRK